MIKVFFISALIHTTMTPDTGWLQWTQSYATRQACHKVIWEDFEKINTAVKAHIGDKIIEIVELRCLTYAEAVKRNSDLGH